MMSPSTVPAQCSVESSAVAKAKRHACAAAPGGTLEADWRRNSPDHRLIVAGFTGRQDTDIIEASLCRQCGDITRSDGPVLTNKMPGLPTIRRLHCYEQMHHIVTI